MKRILSSLVTSLDFAENGLDAVEKFKTERHNLILMDIHMPICDGLEAARMIRKLEEPQPLIVAVTADSLRDECFTIMDDFVSKPFTKLSIEDKIKKWKLKLTRSNK